MTATATNAGSVAERDWTIYVGGRPLPVAGRCDVEDPATGRVLTAVPDLSPGEVVFAVVAENSTREPHRLVVSSIGVAIPTDRNTYGYLSEHHSFGEAEEQAGEYAEELAAEMLATTLDVDFDPDKSWDEKKEMYRISNKIVRTANITQSAVGDKRGLWTTVIAAAILIFE